MVTIVIPVSRETFLGELVDSLNLLECDSESISIFIYVDGSLDLLEKVKKFLLKLEFKNKTFEFRNKGIGSDGSVHRRRQRIADIHNEIKQKIAPCDYVFLIEDDTIVPPDALKKLLNIFITFPHASFASGIELGRWGFPIIGGWLKNGQNRIISVPLQTGIHSADAAGFYCMVTTYQRYVSHSFKPFEKILGPDVNFGFSQDTSGCIDYSIKCSHVTKKGHLDFDKIVPIQILFTRDENNSFGWRQEVV